MPVLRAGCAGCVCSLGPASHMSTAAEQSSGPLKSESVHAGFMPHLSLFFLLGTLSDFSRKIISMNIKRLIRPKGWQRRLGNSPI